MSKYNYSDELRQPFGFGDFNFEKPIPLMIMRLFFSIMNAQAKRYKVSSGLKKSIVQIQITEETSIPCFVIEPETTLDKLPAIIYIHGGAFIGPVQRLMIQNAAFYANALNCRVFVPEYRFAPRYPFPTSLYDSYNSYEHIVENANKYNIDRDKIIIYGESSGGCLAASVCHMIRDNKKHIPKAQMLIYPVTDDSLTSESMEKYKDAFWSKQASKHMWRLYLKNGDFGMKGYAAPLQNQNFNNLPPAYIEPAEIDVLRDEAIAYAEKLTSAGILIELNIIKRAYHAFDSDRNSPLTKRVLEHRLEFMKTIFKSKTNDSK